MKEKPNEETTSSFYTFCSEYVKEFGQEDLQAVGYTELYKTYKKWIS